jgi:protease-4
VQWLLAWARLALGKVLGPLLGPGRVDAVRLRLEGRVAEGERAAADPGVSALWIELRSLRAGWATLQSLRSALVKARERGKKVLVFLEEADNGSAYLASAADRIVMAPAGAMHLVGLRAEVLFLRGALERARVEPEFVRLGEYKSATEPFTRTSLSPEARDALDAILDDLYDQFVIGIAEGRSLTPEQVRALIDAGPYRAGEAKEAGLLDAVLYEDEVEGYLGEMIRAGGKKPAVVPADVYLRHARRSAPPAGTRLPPPRVALLVAEGMIRGGARPARLGRGVASRPFVEALREARDSSRISAIVLRVDSPGGSGLASDIIWREVLLAREKKPVVVSMGDVAASGGYYLSMPAHRIYAEPGSLTGSIGVIAGKFNLRGLYDLLGLAKETLDRGARAGVQSDYRPFTDEERAKLEREVQAYYDDFVDKAAQGRALPREKVESIARGRVWTGRQALARGLVDELGGLTEAVEGAKRRAGIPVAQPVHLEVFPKALPSLLAAWSWNPLRALPRTLQEPLDLADSLDSFRDGEPLAICPFMVTFL